MISLACATPGMLDVEIEGDVPPTVCRARKTLPCQQNHFSRCSCALISVTGSGSAAAGYSGSGGGGGRLLAMLLITVIRMVRWNQSSRCSACGLR